MACQPQDNPKSLSSDGVPPELEVLGFREFLRLTGLTGWREWSDRSCLKPAGDGRLRLARSSAPVC